MAKKLDGKLITVDAAKNLLIPWKPLFIGKKVFCSDNDSSNGITQFFVRNRETIPLQELYVYDSVNMTVTTYTNGHDATVNYLSSSTYNTDELRQYFDVADFIACQPMHSHASKYVNMIADIGKPYIAVVLDKALRLEGIKKLMQSNAVRTWEGKHKVSVTDGVNEEKMTMYFLTNIFGAKK